MKSKNKEKVSIVSAKSVLISGAIAGALGALYLYGTKKGKTSRKKISGIVLKAKGEILEKVEDLKTLDFDSYKKIVSSVVEKYKKTKSSKASELDLLYKELGGYWNEIQKSFTNGKDKVTKSKVKKNV